MVGAGQSLRVNVLASHFNLSNLWMPDDAHAAIQRKSEQPDKTGLVFLLSNFLISLFLKTARNLPFGKVALLCLLSNQEYLQCGRMNQPKSSRQLSLLLEGRFHKCFGGSRPKCTWCRDDDPGDFLRCLVCRRFGNCGIGKPGPGFSFQH